MKKMLLAALIFSGVFTAAALEFSDAEIVLVPKASIVAESAAADLQYHLQKMTGGKFPIVRKRSNNYAAAIYLGKAARQAGMPVDKLKKDGFFRVVKGKNIYIAGNDDPQVGRRDFVYIYFFVQKRGTMHGVYDFLESLGVLWPAPGTKYEYIPRKKSIKLADSVKVDNPVFIERGATGIWNFKKFPDAGEYTKNPSEAVTWAMRLRISNIRGIATGSHSEQFLKLDKVWFKKYPERFQKMKNGKRNPRYCCWSSPEVREAWLAAADGFFSGKKPSEVGLGHLKSWRGQNKNDEFLIDPMDHGAANDGRCRCDKCNAFRKKHPGPDDTELYWQTIAYVAQKLEKKHPGKYITTLVYPPKTRFPKTVKVPANIRVRICQQGIKTMMLSNVIKHDLAQQKQWADMVGADNVPLWTYQCENFARRLPGVPENYPYLAAEYLRTVAGKIAGIKNEFTDPVFSTRLPDLYIQSKLLWNPGQDVKKLLKDYFKVMYGPAAGVMEEIYQTFENNFRKYYPAVTPNVPNPKEIGSNRDIKGNRLFAWGKIYTKQEMARISNMISKAEKLAAGKAPYAERIKLFRKWVWEITEMERREVMNMEELIPSLTLKKGQWSPEQKLVSANRLVRDLTNPTSFRLKHDGNKLYISVKATEKTPGKVFVVPKTELENIWRDDTVEFFLFTPGNALLRHGIFSSANRCIVQYVEAKKQSWKKWPGMKFTMKTSGNQRFIEIELPMDNLMKKEFRFNLVRARKIMEKRKEVEDSTWSKAAGLGNWFVTESYGRIICK